MGDYASGLPIRSEADGSDERLHVKIVDGVDPSKRATVDSDLNVHVQVHGDNPAGTDEVLRLSELGAVTPDGVYDATDNTKPGNVGLVASVRDVAPSDTTQTQRLTSVTNGSKRLLDIAIHDEAGAAYSTSNPLPVVLSETEGGSPLHNYNTVASVAAAASSNHDYTSTGVVTTVKSIKATGSGKLKIEVQYDADGVGVGPFVSLYVGFNSTANPNIDYSFDQPIVMASGSVLRVIRTNRDNQSQDVYSTINGTTV